MHPTMYGRRSVLEGLGGYQKTPSEDYDLWLRAAASGARMKRMAYLPTIVYRRHAAQLSSARAWATEGGDTALSASFRALASQQLNFQGSAATILYSRPTASEPYPDDPDINDFTHRVLEAAGRLGERDRKGIEDRLRSMYRL
ncbi:hypothetical protein NHF46_15800 [Arthrobacter alpinus]|nr:hypothetical protein [Arthrobacter alpinus]